MPFICTENNGKKKSCRRPGLLHSKEKRREGAKIAKEDAKKTCAFPPSRFS
jgi:hypothetical protein